jgi:hypothetical protein
MAAFITCGLRRAAAIRMYSTTLSLGSSSARLPSKLQPGCAPGSGRRAQECHATRVPRGRTHRHRHVSAAKAHGIATVEIGLALAMPLEVALPALAGSAEELVLALRRAGFHERRRRGSGVRCIGDAGADDGGSRDEHWDEYCKRRCLRAEGRPQPRGRSRQGRVAITPTRASDRDSFPTQSVGAVPRETCY